MAFENAKDELTDYVFYTELSKSERKKNISFKRILTLSRYGICTLHVLEYV